MEELISVIKDRAFHSRFVFEYESVSRWSDKGLAPEARILDFGCGQGIAALGFALRHPAASVSGIDVAAFHEKLPGLVLRNLGTPIPGNLEFHVSSGTGLPFASGSQDLVYSWSVFEHVRKDLIPQILQELSRVLKEDGHLFIQIEPLYFSPKGAHLYDVLGAPWVHLILQHDVLLENVMASDLPDHRKANLVQQYESLNRITADELIDLVAENGFEILRKSIAKCDLVPPESLRKVYTDDALTTKGVQLLAVRRP